MIWETRRKLRQLLRNARPETQQKTFQELTDNRFRNRLVLFVAGWSMLGIALLKFLFERSDPFTGNVYTVSPTQAKNELWASEKPNLFQAMSGESKPPPDTNSYVLDD